MSTELSTLEARLTQVENEFRKEKRKFRVQMCLALFAIVASIFLSPANRAVVAQGYGITLQQLAARLTQVETKTKFISNMNGDMYIVGANLHIRSGSGATNGNPSDPTATDITTSVNGKGNLIIGYNEANPVTGAGTQRGGSHNLILGSYHNYESFGGIVSGTTNNLEDAHCVSFGSKNSARGVGSTITGGGENIAFGDFSSISGGFGNGTAGALSSVSGGSGNTTNGLFSSISGGSNNKANGSTSAVHGGTENIATGQLSVVSGGNSNTAGAIASTVSGGTNLTQSNINGWTGGSFHTP